MNNPVSYTRTGKPRGRPRGELGDRFWPRVDKNGPEVEINGHKSLCWLWRGKNRGFGYSAIWYRGHVVSAHRAAWILTYGDIPPGIHIMRTCPTPDCCNPEHCYRADTNQRGTENAAGATRGWYMLPGSKKPLRRIYTDDLHQIQKRMNYAASSGDQHKIQTAAARLSEKYQVHASFLVDLATVEDRDVFIREASSWQAPKEDFWDE